MTTWLVEHVEQLVALYKQHPELWDCGVKEYYNKDDRSAAIKRISREIRKPEGDVLKKIKCLRTYYCRELKSINSLSDKAKWMHFDSLDFLRDHVTLKSRTPQMEEDNTSVASLSEVQNEYGHQSGVDWSTVKDEPIDDLEDDVNSPLELQIEATPTTTPRLATTAPPKAFTPPPQTTRKTTLKRKASPHSRAEAWLHQNKEQKIEDPTQQDSEPSENDVLFGKIVAEELRHVHDAQTKQLAKLRIQALLFEARFGTSIEMKSFDRPTGSRQTYLTESNVAAPTSHHIPGNRDAEINRKSMVAESSSPKQRPKSPVVVYHQSNLSPVASPI
ncbi:uncharacterized protein LOC141906071 [Tubulanus polymorphus]|uniref:uncharacterized protein LOC141906071 n=1 Tax=Tubulanus polymorphus TaxID=672921 RepID=UPI003DA5E1E7